jgi:hypothetical protein
VVCIGSPARFKISLMALDTSPILRGVFDSIGGLEGAFARDFPSDLVQPLDQVGGLRV